jgi:hypothetical protein
MESVGARQGPLGPAGATARRDAATEFGTINELIDDLVTGERPRKRRVLQRRAEATSKRSGKPSLDVDAELADGIARLELERRRVGRRAAGEESADADCKRQASPAQSRIGAAFEPSSKSGLAGLLAAVISQPSSAGGAGVVAAAATGGDGAGRRR